jgi:REP element-mobilizing transposase RayT
MGLPQSGGMTREGNPYGRCEQSTRGSEMGYADVEAFLNERDSRRSFRREHHLPLEEYRRTDVPFWLTLCARHHGEPFRNPDLAAAVIEALTVRQARRIWIVYAYCLMPDHLHAVIQLRGPGDGLPAEKSLLQLLGEFKSFTARRASALGFHGRLWQHDQYDRLLRNDREFEARCRYLLENPVRKGLVEDWTLWPYSGILNDWEQG